MGGDVKNLNPWNTLAMVVGIVVLGMVVYARVRPGPPNCETIFEQTAPILGATLDTIKIKGQAFVGRETIQELDKSAHTMAVQLETCCIVLDKGEINSEEFLKCQAGVKTYETDVDKVANALVEAQAAKERGKTEEVSAKLDQINKIVAAVDAQARKFESDVKMIAARPVSGYSQETEFPGVVADLTRFEDTGGMLTVEVTFRNTSEQPVKICVQEINYSSYLLDEAAGTIWKVNSYDGYISCGGPKTLDPGGRHVIWMKYKIEGDRPDRFTAVVDKVVRPFERIAPIKGH